MRKFFINSLEVSCAIDDAALFAALASLSKRDELAKTIWDEEMDIASCDLYEYQMAIVVSEYSFEEYRDEFFKEVVEVIKSNKNYDTAHAFSDEEAEVILEVAARSVWGKIMSESVYEDGQDSVFYNTFDDGDPRYLFF